MGVKSCKVCGSICKWVGLSHGGWGDGVPESIVDVLL